MLKHNKLHLVQQYKLEKKRVNHKVLGHDRKTKNYGAEVMCADKANPTVTV